jgi:hypothetical protein
MKSAEDVESYLLRMGLTYETVKPGIWLLQIGGPRLAVSIAGQVVAFRLKMMDLPPTGREELFRTLLSLNTNEMVHGAFGLEGEAVVIVHALDLENLDLSELQAVIDDMSMAAAKHQPKLARFVTGQRDGASAHV